MSESIAGTSNGEHTEESDEMVTYKKSACKVVTFQIIYDVGDLNSGSKISFKPEMAHQIFGESESIFGYRDISITINMLHNSCQCYLNLQISGNISRPDLKPDDVLKALDPWLPSNYTQNSDEFVEWVKNEHHDVIFGETICSFEGSGEDCKTSTYLITQNDTSSKEFQDFHARFETYIIWFIDAANYIDLDDDKWLIFYVYEEFKHPVKKIVYRTPVAFCTVYKFYAYPDKIRPRISQIFVLPSHQRKGIGTKLYETISKTLRAERIVIDLAVEEPTPCFQKIRDLEDCGLLHQKILEENINFFRTSSKEIFSLACKLKIGRKQIRRVYDILALYYALKNGNMQHKKIVGNIKTRILNELERETSPGKRFCGMNREAIPNQDIQNKKELGEAAFIKYYNDIQPSVKYLMVKLDSWMERNKF